MSSESNSRQNSIIHVEVMLREISKSLPQTPAKKQHQLPFRTVPDSPKHCRLLSDDHGLDLEVLTHKLQLYQLELEEAELRFKQRRMVNKEAADVAAAARFRVELEKKDVPDKQNGAHLSSSQSHRPFPNRSSSLRTPNMVRSKRPNPLLLAATSDVAPQEVQSAALPPRRTTMSQGEENKRLWRRTTISAGRDTSSNIVTISSPGHHEEQSFDAAIPPVPDLSASSSVTSSNLSPMTPGPNEDQIRRELETFALEEGPDIRMSRRSSVASRKRIAAFVPDPEDRLLPALPVPTTFDDFQLPIPMKIELARKKSFFSRFERKNEVEALLDLYMTDQQIEDQKSAKKKAHRSRRQSFFQRWQPREHDPMPKSPKPG